MSNRKIPPPVHEIRNLLLPHPQQLRLDNGIPVYVLDFPGQEILKIEIVYRVGRPQETKHIVSRATARLLREGTQRMNSAEIAEYLDFYGASLSVPVSLDTANFTLFSLKKYAAEVIPVFADVLLNPVFPEKELDTFRQTSIQELSVELEKVEVLAYRKITEFIFGAEHPYGYNSTVEDYNALTRNDLQEFYRRWYTPGNCMVFAAGRVDDAVMELLNRCFGQHQVREGARSDFRSDVTAAKPLVVKMKHPGALQSAVKIGRRLFNRLHPDYDGMFVLNTILGGYFGSRLMTNIREKRGYTYNIYSTADSMLYDGCFYIATEVNKNKTAATIKAIFAELKDLREKPVEDEELAMVRNYLLGMLLNGLDGPLNTSDVVRSIIIDNLPLESFDRLVHTIRTITPEQLRALAEKYLQPEDFWTVTVTE
jgi:zinc protease